jgi:hypothetical protein
MKRVFVFSLVVLVLLISAPAAFAWDRAVGCTVDSSGDSWTWGGTVTCRQTFNPFVQVGQGTLDADGCFEVYIGNGHEVECTIDYNAGPAGDPVDGSCVVPTDNNYMPEPWACGTIDTGTGPNAVALSGFAGVTAMPAGSLVLALGAALGGAAVWLRRR